MSALPKSVIPTDEVELSGGKVLVRGLTRAERNRVGANAEEAEKAEAIAIACACDMSEADALEWLQTASSEDAEKLQTRILELSGIAAGQGKD